MSFSTIQRTINYSLSGLAVLATALALWVIVMPSVKADTTRGSDEHLVTIHDRGKEKSVISKKDTLGEVLKESKIILDKNDIVEPSLNEKLVATAYQVNIYRARPVVIVDGANKLLVMSAYQTPRQIAEHAGLSLYREDTATMTLSDNIVRDGASVRLEIDRAAAITLVLYGKQEQLHTQTSTVGDFLKEKNITLRPNDTISSAVTTAIYSGMKLEIWHNGKQTITVDEPVQFETVQIRDANQPVGYRKVQTPGVLGKKTVTYEIDMQSGKEVSRKQLQSVDVEKPSKQVEVIGANAAHLGGSCGEWIAGAGITDLANASYLIQKESGCNPYAVNKSSGACGVGQALPCSKTGCAMGDGQCQTIWMNSYVMGRYGSWEAAANHHRNYGWY